jgi:hypothetical protein
VCNASALIQQLFEKEEIGKNDEDYLMLIVRLEDLPFKYKRVFFCADFDACANLRNATV